MPAITIALLSAGFCAAAATSALAQKSAALESVARREPQAWETALRIWEWAEPGYQEKQSSELLAKQLEGAGFQVARGVAGIPTAFTATVGSGPPVLGILGEFDALPGLSQQAVPFRQPREGSNWGHGCGHHLFGAASASAAIALGEQIRAGKLRGTVRFYGCPAEEGGSAKAFLVRAGLFQDCHAVLHWHPGNRNTAGSKSTFARIAVRFRFRGKASHAAGSPELGRSALDAVELTNHAAQLLREHTPDSTRIHHVITAGGGAPNVVPDFAEVYYYVRHPSADVARDVYRRLVLCAQAGALATETKLEVRYEGGTRDLLPNDVLARVVQDNLKSLCDLKLTEEDLRFALKLQETLDDKRPLDEYGQVYDETGRTTKGSTDVGDVSWVVPTAGFSTACFVPGTPTHTWQATACGGTPIGRRGLHLAARVLTASGWDLLTSPDVLTQAKTELARRTGPTPYRSLLEPDQKPALDYRNAPATN